MAFEKFEVDALDRYTEEVDSLRDSFEREEILYSRYLVLKQEAYDRCKAALKLEDGA